MAAKYRKQNPLEKSMGNGKLLFNGTEFWFGKMKKDLEMDGSDDYTKM